MLTEHQLQASIFEYWRLQGKTELHMFAIENGGLRDIRVAVRLKKAGVSPGTPDICVMLRNGDVAWIELKTPNGRLSPEQKEFQRRCRLNAHAYFVVRSLEQAIDVLRGLGALKGNK